MNHQKGFYACGDDKVMSDDQECKKHILEED